jgi:hypothetical protein
VAERRVLMQSGEGVKGSVERRRRREVRHERTAVERGELLVYSSNSSEEKGRRLAGSGGREGRETKHLVRDVPCSKDPLTARVLLQVVEEEVGTSSRCRFRIECLSAFVNLVENCFSVSSAP